jgi:hypothetical protein
MSFLSRFFGQNNTENHTGGFRSIVPNGAPTVPNRAKPARMNQVAPEPGNSLYMFTNTRNLDNHCLTDKAIAVKIRSEQIVKQPVMPELGILYSNLDTILNSGNQNQRSFAIAILESMRLTNVSQAVIGLHAEQVLKHQIQYVEDYLPQLTNAPEKALQSQFTQLQTCLQAIQSTSVTTKPDKIWIEKSKQVLCNAWTVNALTSQANRTYTAIVLCLWGSDNEATKNNIELLLNNAFSKSEPQALSTNNLLVSTLKFISEKTNRQPVDILSHYLKKMPPEFVNHPLQKQKIGHISQDLTNPSVPLTQ